MMMMKHDEKEFDKDEQEYVRACQFLITWFNMFKICLKFRWTLMQDNAWHL